MGISRHLRLVDRAADARCVIYAGELRRLVRGFQRNPFRSLEDLDRLLASLNELADRMDGREPEGKPTTREPIRHGSAIW